MTVTYTHQVATSRGLGCFARLLFRWKGSIYKLVWPDLLVYGFLYGSLSIIYRLLLSEPRKRIFEQVALHCQQFTDLIPVSFVLGFYVSIVVQRWWNQWLSLPWPDSLALFISTCIVGQSDRSRLLRRTVMRYVNLTFVITFSMISPRAKKRFPTMDHLLEAGLLTPTEKKIFDDLNSKTNHPKYWMPLVWAGAIVGTARKEGKIRDDFAVKTILDEINQLRSLCGGLLGYDWISIPLVYTQVVTLAVYTFFLGTLMGRQFLDPAQDLTGKTVDFYVPVFTFLQFFFYMGWLKVAETLVNPFGEDDDDFEVNWLIDRNMQVSYLIVDEMHEEHPDLIPDIYWDDVFPQELPYTIAAEQYKKDGPVGSTFNLEVPEEDQEILMPVLEEEEEVNVDTVQRIHSNNSLQSLGSGILMRPTTGSRKGSILSSIINKVTPKKESRISQNFSARRLRQFPRSSSRFSGHSSNNSKSKDSLARNETQTSFVYHRSVNEQQKQDTQNSSAENGDSNPPSLQPDWSGNDSNFSKEVSVEPDGTLVIRVKQNALVNASGRSTPSSTGTILPRASPLSSKISASAAINLSEERHSIDKAETASLSSSKAFNASHDSALQERMASAGIRSSSGKSDKSATSGSQNQKTFVPLNSLPEDCGATEKEFDPAFLEAEINDEQKNIDS